MVFQNTGKKATELYRAFIFYFSFLGHLIASVFLHSNAIVWRPTFTTTLIAGGWIVFPLIVVSVLIGMSMALSIHYILAPFHLQHQAIIIAQTTMLHDAAPLLIGFVLCVHCSLNLINPKHPSLKHSPQDVLLKTIIPLIVSINCTALLLYIYVTLSFLIGVYFTFYYFLQININEYLAGLNDIIYSSDIVGSVAKSLLFATIASVTAGYYYYDVASRILSTRTAVSRIITRGLFWLVVISVLIKL